MDANEMFDTMMRELNEKILSDADGSEEQESFSFHEETQDSDDIPPSLLCYFEASKSRAAVCEKLILEDLEASPPSHHTEDMMNFPSELDEDMMKLKKQGICDEENEENNTSTDPFVLPSPTETEALFTDVVSVCPNNEDEYVDIEKQLTLQYEAERKKRHCEEMKKEERRRQRERDFQEELQKIMEAERLHQKELELMGKRAQEKLEQELLFQQELISNLQRRVEEERKMREEEQKRIKDEEDKRRREEEKIKMEAERKRMDKERKIEEMKLKKEEDQKRRMEREEQRKREEEKLKMEAVRKRMEEEMRKEEEERKIEEMKLKEEEEKRRMEREEKRMKEEEQKRMKDEEDKMIREEETKKMEAERKRMEEERKIEEMKRKNEEEKKRKMEMEEMRKMREGEQKRMKDEKDRRREEETKKMEAERKKMEEEMRRKKEEERKIEEMKCKNEERRRMEEERHKIILEKKQLEDEIRMMEEEERKKKEEAERRERKEEEERKELKESRKKMERDKRKLEEEISLKKKEEEERKKKEEENVRIEKEMEEEEVDENKKEVNKKTEEGGRLKEESKERMVQEKEVKVEDEENSLMDENEKKNKDKTENTLASQRGDGTSWTSSSSLHSESTTSPTSTETRPPQHDPEENISQTSTDQTVDSTVSVFSTVCLPEHTERKRLSWMRDCVPWSKLSLRNRRKQKGSVRGRRGPRGAAEAGSLPPLCPHSLLRATGWKSLQEVTTVTLEDLPGCNLSTLTQCSQLRSLTLRRCGLRSLDGIKQLPQLCYIDVQENDISSVDCENMTSLRVLHLSHNKLTSIHGLTGAENLDVLDLAHNSITRIAGLESVRRLQRLSVDHNQLISTKGLRDIYTLLHLNLSHNHLAAVEGLENSALLHTLDLRANSLTEPPNLNNQVLLRELHLDDNSISSLQSLTACWLPLMLHLSVAQNRITQLPSMSDSVSLTNLDLRFNCMSEIQNVCESLEGCQFLREVHLTGNPLQQETGWRSTLQKAVPGLRLIDDQQTDSVLTPPVVQQFSSASGSFLMFCQTQLQQTQDLQQRHSRELSDASSSLDALKTSCRHSSEALQLAEEQRFAHEYGDTTVTDKHRATSQTTPEDTPDVDHNSTEKSTELQGMESTGKVPQFVPHGDRRSYWSSEEKSAAESQHNGFHSVTAGPKTGLTVGKANSGSVHSSATRGKTSSSSLDMVPVSNHQNLQSTAAVVIQQLWRKYRQKCGNSSSSSTAEKGGGRGGDGGKPESGPSYINGSVVGKDYAATVIQAFWRGFTLRRRLASALAAVTCSDSGEDDTFEEVDVDEFVFDEAALEKQWMLSLSEDSTPRRYPVSEQQPSVKPPVHFFEPSQCILPPPAVRRPKQAWVSGEQVDSAGRRVSPESSNRSKSPASASVLSGLSERSEKILEEWGFTDSNTALLMLKRAQKMKPTKQKRRRDPSVRLAMFRNCSYQLGPVEARNRPAQHNRNDIKVGEAEPGLQQAEKVERVKQERAQQWLQTQAAHSDRDSESVHFLPEISSDVLNGGRVQLVADPGYTERRHHARGLWANNSLAAQPRRENSYPRRNSVGCARKEVPSPQRVTSAPSKKERISFRDNPVELSSGWGGGKKRDKVYK
ncbi:leucine-rich repeat and IQ domain-containing protein 1 isoform X1 [Epinephelus moara]|uniref:leucine-rich repeat and IQ domain-containing protein 1 isoform X1 n=2 Tax=Epinephelus moara TaxID=300413 RepID=UPI00214F4412|nr:leucine-rich repeat and IQ domain-containing protein 1 isoform X1 [Epinephelus moara]